MALSFLKWVMFCLKWTERFLTFLKRCLSILLALKPNRTKRKLFFVRYCMYLVQPRQLPITMTQGISISISACTVAALTEGSANSVTSKTLSLLNSLSYFISLYHYLVWSWSPNYVSCIHRAGQFICPMRRDVWTMEQVSFCALVMYIYLSKS